MGVQTMIDWPALTDTEQEAVTDIAQRAKKKFDKMGVPRSVIDIEMDIQAAHADTPLKLEALATADDFNFSHDVMGIYRHLNRRTGKLEDCFLPRHAILN
jgi:hypothetical protein